MQRIQGPGPKKQTAYEEIAKEIGTTGKHITIKHLTNLQINKEMRDPKIIDKVEAVNINDPTCINRNSLAKRK